MRSPDLPLIPATRAVPTLCHGSDRAGHSLGTRLLLPQPPAGKQKQIGGAFPVSPLISAGQKAAEICVHPTRQNGTLRALVLSQEARSPEATRGKVWDMVSAWRADHSIPRASMDSIPRASMDRACPLRASELRLAPRPFLCKRGKAAGSRDFKRIWVIQTGCGRRSAITNQNQAAAVSPPLAGAGIPGSERRLWGGGQVGPREHSARC